MKYPKCKKGNVYGRWTVIGDLYGLLVSSKVECQCSCGVIRAIAISSLVYGQSLSCGCLQKEKVSTLANETCLKHGCAKKGKRTRAYYAWKGMKTRCFNAKSERYADYGGRGITVCDRWKNSFINFLEDMGEPADGLTLDRKDNEGDYSPDNCHWITMVAQQNNRRSNHLITYNGETRNVSQWAELMGIPMKTLHKRLKLGWDTHTAFTKEVR